MNKEELKIILSGISPAATFDETGDWLNVSVDAADWIGLARELRSLTDLSFDYLFCLSGVDWKTYLSVVYHLSSKLHGHNLVVKVKIADRENPTIDTVSGLWRTAEFHELEAYDLFGIKFIGHPGLRRLFLTDDWVGWPLRKDYTDPVNMIEL